MEPKQKTKLSLQKDKKPTKLNSQINSYKTNTTNIKKTFQTSTHSLIKNKTNIEDTKKNSKNLTTFNSILSDNDDRSLYKLLSRQTSPKQSKLSNFK
jgi:septal ring factor EnvC (AmiA/AmiB activator)